ncbi:uncharacterized protein CcaverHIS019_0205700 [Cutaneotrichosporon cavernicola]|uniref:Mediator of RNA polymerase II transcription subunit 14 n=1 Tax=Cutaneotrichosporon cavernicola TaxID=279322 RepID=A0AA48IIH3_9TREE|nr:uncharacterized protein CcaverHIS019_0205700 [Cutaneotrichosporon cavernicola]BEI89208.1 hypothetical protein CcaverHIS019_0205700 [Cutaneotrichosporon cavernicola]BEJ04758.1 hypothetical protein CcaverHIS641_0205750 [Cutaneotrichosporon cavernicola]
MSAFTNQRPPAGAHSGQQPSAGPSALSGPSGPLHEQPQPVASSSRNPQLGPHPYFRYPTPSTEHIEDELPPYWEEENVPLGPLLDRLARKSYSDMRMLVEKTLPPLAPRQKPKHVIEYAKTTRQAVLKYLAVLRWKTSVDLATATQPQANGHPAAAAFPTPLSNGESNDTSPVSYPLKGKARVDGTAEEPVVRGKVTDARRIQHFLEHQNQQQEAAITHLRHVTGMIDMLRERNADLLTALAVQSTGTYSRLPSQLMDWIPRPPLKPPVVLDTVGRLNDHTLYRLRCIDYVPPDMVVERVTDGRVYVRGGGENGWVAQLSLEGFEDDSKWWLCGFEWAWKVDGAEAAKPFSAQELLQILNMCNQEVLVAQEVEEHQEQEGKTDGNESTVDAPLVRVYNFLQHLSLAYQLEALYSQALAMTQGRWRGQLQVEIDRTKKELRLRYWIRQRPQAPALVAPGSMRPQPPQSASSSSNKGPMVGGTITIALAEAATPMSEAERVLREVAVCGVEPVDRTVRFELGIKWEVGEAGAGGGLRAGEAMDASGLRIDPSSLSMKGIVTTATRAHAAHLSRVNTALLLTNERLILDPHNPPRMEESESSSTRPVCLIVPLPSRGQLSVSVSSISGLLEIEDSIARDNGQVMENNRTLRAKLATNSSNEQKTRLADDVYRLVSAIIVEDIEDNLRQLGLHPLRRVALRTNDTKSDLHPSSTVFVPLPVSQNHYFVAKVTTKGIAYELLKLLRVPMEGNGGMRMSVGDRIPIDLAKLVERRAAKGAKRGLDAEDAVTELDVLKWESRSEKSCPFQVHARDLQDMFTYCNALVAQTMVEQQLKDRGIPYTTQFPEENDFAAPRSRSALAGMIPNICVNASHLFKDGRAAEVASPKVFLVIKNWWSGTQCSIETIVRLRHQPSLDSQPAAPVVRATDAGRSEGITFDQNTLTVRFHAPSIARCVPDFLEQWERLSKVIVVAGEVNRLNKQEEFRDIRMLSFDLCTASVQYAPGFNVAITYTPTSDSYEASFSRAGLNSATPAPTGTLPTDSGDNPHAALAPLLSAHLNELTQLAPVGGRGHAGRDFLQLLRTTLPLLLEAEALRVARASPYPALVVRSVTEYRLVWDHEGSTPARYALDVLLTQTCGARFLLCDATRRKDVPDDLTCGPLTPIPNIGNAMLKGFQAAKIAKVSTPCGPAGTPRTPNPKTPKTPREGRLAVKSIAPAMPPAARLDGGESMVCSVGVMHDVLRAISNEIEIAIGGVPTGPGSVRG